METSARPGRELVAVVALAAAFGAGLAAGRGCGPEPGGVDARDVSPASSHAASAKPHLAPTPRARDRVADTTATPAAMSAERADAADATPPREGDEFPSAEVEVVWADGSCAVEATVYAIPAGATDVDDAPVTGLSGTRARLHVLEPGLYDVGALCGLSQVLVHDVRFPHEGVLRLEFPPTGEVVVRMPLEGLPTAGESKNSGYAFSLVRSGDRFAYPGRGETSHGSATGRITPDGAPWSARAPLHARLRLQLDDRFRAEPGEFTAPAEVRLTSLPRYPVSVWVELRPPDRRLTSNVSLGVHFRQEGSAWTHHFGGKFDAGVPFDRASARWVFNTEFDAAAGTLRWSGDGVVPGEQRFEGLAAGELSALVVPVELLPDDEFVAAAASRSSQAASLARRTTVRVLTEAGAPTSDAEVEVRDAEGECLNMIYGPDQEVLVETMAPPRWAMACTGDSVSPVVSLSGWTASPVTLRLERGGYLLAMPEASSAVPSELGSPRIERRHGAPFTVGGSIYTSEELTPGLVLGPLPPGPIEFRVVLRGRVLATARATVRAGAYEVLRIPRLRAPTAESDR